MLLNLYDKNKEIANLEKHACKNRILIETSNSNIIFHIKKSYKWFKAASSDTFAPAFACLNRVKTYSVNLFVSLAKWENGVGLVNKIHKKGPFTFVSASFEVTAGSARTSA